MTPAAYIQPGYSDLMPHTFGTQISPPTSNQLVQYLADNAQKK